MDFSAPNPCALRIAFRGSRLRPSKLDTSLLTGGLHQESQETEKVVQTQEIGQPTT